MDTDRAKQTNASGIRLQFGVCVQRLARCFGFFSRDFDGNSHFRSLRRKGRNQRDIGGMQAGAAKNGSEDFRLFGAGDGADRNERGFSHDEFVQGVLMQLWFVWRC
jgi:hypothetical protein